MVSEMNLEVLRAMPSYAVKGKRHTGEKLCEALAYEIDSCLTGSLAEWINGFPLGWLAVESSETPSHRPSPNGSDAAS